MNWAEWLLPVAVLLLLYWGLRRVLIARALGGMRFLQISTLENPRADTPGHLSSLFEEASTELESLGFHFVTALESSPSFEGGERIWQWVYLQQDSRVYGFVGKSPWPDSPRAWAISLVTYSPKTTYVTSDQSPSPMFEESPSFNLLYQPGASAQILWQAHGERLPELEQRIVFAPGEGAAFRDKLHTQMLEHNTTLGYLRKTASDEGGWQIPFLRAFLIGPKIVASHKAAANGARVLSSASAGNSASQLDWEAYQAAEGAAEARKPLSGTTKLLLLVGTLILFLISFGFQLSWQTSLPILLGVLTFHEFGHLLGMRMFGYKNLSMLYLPFLGAVAIGERDQVAPWKEVVVLFLGPLPGLFLGIALWVSGWAVQAWQNELVMMLMVLNLFNLLPIHPLDGGQILSLTLFSRFPTLRAIFGTLGAAGFILMGIYLSATALTLIGVFLLLPTLRNFRSARIEALVRKTAPNCHLEEKGSLAKRVLEQIAQRRYYPRSFPHRYIVAKSAVQQLRRPRAGLLTILFTGIAYTSPVWLTAAVGIPVSMHRTNQLNAEVKSEWDKSELRAELFPKNTVPDAQLLIEIAEDLEVSEQLSEELKARIQNACQTPTAVEGNLIPDEYSEIEKCLTLYVQEQESPDAELLLLAWRLEYSTRNYGGVNMLGVLGVTESLLLRVDRPTLEKILPELERLMPTPPELSARLRKAELRFILAVSCGVNWVTGEFAPQSSDFGLLPDDSEATALRKLMKAGESSKGVFDYQYERRRITLKKFDLACAALIAYREFLKNNAYPQNLELPADLEVQMKQDDDGWFLETPGPVRDHFPEGTGPLVWRLGPASRLA